MSTKILAGRYELFEKIGEGGMSVVYKAKDRMLNRFVAIKILKPDFVSDKKFIESFRRESQAAASLAHPNIVSIFDVGQEGNIHYIVMELIEGQTLSDMIKEMGPLPYQKVIEFSKQIAAALSLAHKNHIIHRDVKPHNVLITQSGTAKITDFGIAKAMNSATIVETTGGGVIGSVHYFSPEQARGGYVDEKSDIYSLGIVMYEMLTGRVPFDGDNPVNIALMHINSKMVLPSQLIAGVPPALEQIILKATDKIQTNRFVSADELIEALNNLQFVGSVVGDTSVFMGVNAANDMADPNKPLVVTDYDDGEDDDDDDDEPKKKKKKKPLTKKQKIMIGAIAGAVVLIVGIAVAFGLLGGKEVTVPDLTNMTLEDAQELAEEAGQFKVEEDMQVYDNDVEEGKIVSQDPGPNRKAKEGSTIKVNISKGSEEGNVPSVIGKTESEAQQILEDAGYELGSVTTDKGEQDKDKVESQTPNAGDGAKKGSKVDIVLSDGSKAKEEVPNLLGQDVDDAKGALSDAGFSLGGISYGNSDEYPANTVMWQQYPGGTEKSKGTSIKIKVSKGPSSGSSQSIYVDYGAAKNEVFRLTVTLSDSNGTRNIISNQQRYKSDGGETVTMEGKGKGTVTIIFDGKQVDKKNVSF